MGMVAFAIYGDFYIFIQCGTVVGAVCASLHAGTGRFGAETAAGTETDRPAQSEV